MRWRLAAVAMVVGLTGAACGGGDDGELVDPTTTTTRPDCKVDGGAADANDAAATEVEVQLSEYAVVASPAEVTAGMVRVAARNDGLIEHEVMVLRYDGDPEALPLSPVGGVDTSQLPDDAVVGWIRLFGPGKACSGTFDLAAGQYVLLCNAVDDATNPHFGHGMWTRFTVA